MTAAEQSVRTSAVPGSAAAEGTRLRDLPPGSAAVVLGTRPELIKLSPLLLALGRTASLVHTGQHYEPVLATGVLRGIGLPEPRIRLGVGGQLRGEQIGHASAALTQQWAAAPPRVVVVHGDTNATLAGALAANSLEIPLVHVEAGLRSHDRAMPEEHNRILVDHLADLCCAPTPGNAANLRHEGIPDTRIALTGNTIVEALTNIERDSPGAHRILNDQGIQLGTDPFVLCTLHRPENVDDPARLHQVLARLGRLSAPVLLVLHPRTRQRIHRFGLTGLLQRLHTTQPLPYPTFLALAEQAALLVSDSGGVQEEASVLKKPLLVLRRSTERPEAIGSFATLIRQIEALRTAAEHALTADNRTLKALPTPFGDGRATDRILHAISEVISGSIGMAAIPPPETMAA